MLVLITYDINTGTSKGRKRLHDIAEKCEDYGQRVNNSVFECKLDNAQMIKLRNELVKMIDRKTDSIRFYNLGDRYAGRIEQYGCKVSYDPEGTLLL